MNMHYFRVVHSDISAYIYIYILPYRYRETTRKQLPAGPAERAEEGRLLTPPAVAEEGSSDGESKQVASLQQAIEGEEKADF